MISGGHMTNTPPTITYARAASCETVRITLTVAELHDMSVKNSDIMNYYIKAPCKEKVYNILGQEFGSDKEKLAVIVRELYGLKSSSA